MAVRGIIACILFCGILISTLAPLCRAQETGKLLDVKMPQKEPSPAYLPESTTLPAQGPVQAKRPDTAAPEKEWYWRLLEGMLLNIAVFHTEQERDGRPQPPGSSR